MRDAQPPQGLNHHDITEKMKQDVPLVSVNL